MTTRVESDVNGGRHAVCSPSPPRGSRWSSCCGPYAHRSAPCNCAVSGRRPSSGATRCRTSCRICSYSSRRNSYGSSRRSSDTADSTGSVASRSRIRSTVVGALAVDLDGEVRSGAGHGRSFREHEAWRPQDRDTAADGTGRQGSDVFGRTDRGRGAAVVDMPPGDQPGTGARTVPRRATYVHRGPPPVRDLRVQRTSSAPASVKGLRCSPHLPRNGWAVAATGRTGTTAAVESRARREMSDTPSQSPPPVADRVGKRGCVG